MWDYKRKKKFNKMIFRNIQRLHYSVKVLPTHIKHSSIFDDKVKRRLTRKKRKNNLRNREVIKKIIYAIRHINGNQNFTEWSVNHEILAELVLERMVGVGKRIFSKERYHNDILKFHAVHTKYLMSNCDKIADNNLRDIVKHFIATIHNAVNLRDGFIYPIYDGSYQFDFEKAANDCVSKSKFIRVIVNAQKFHTLFRAKQKEIDRF